MPNNENWDQIHSRGEIDVEPKNWKSLTIEFGYKNLNGVLFFCWRVKDTQHTFTIQFSQLNELSQDNVSEHIQTFLETFGEELIGWIVNGLKEEWQKQYYQQYKSFIEI